MITHAITLALTTPTAKAVRFFGLVGACHQHHTSQGDRIKLAVEVAIPSLLRFSKEVRGAKTYSLVLLRLANEDRSCTCATSQLLKSATLSFRLVYIKRHTNVFACHYVA